MFGWFRKLLKEVQGASLKFGNQGETEAARFLEGLGYRILHRQLRGRYGELDLVARDGQTIVFVEVKTRASTAAGHPTESITLAKQKKITQSALEFLKRHRWLNQKARFDVISIIWPKGGEPPQLQHYINAFEPVGSGQMYS
jgi:putative endonuclease